MVLTEAQCKIIAEAKAEAARIAEENKKWEVIEAYKQKLAENDLTDIDVVPIILNDEPFLEIQGLFFNEHGGFPEDAEPAQELIIEKDVLDRSSGFIVGRFGYAIQNRGKIVFEVYVDNHKIDDYGTNLPYMSNGGIYTTTLFKYPNNVKLGKDGKHVIRVKAGVITGIVEGNTRGKNEGLGLMKWGEIKGITEKSFVITLLPHKIVD